MYSVCLFLESSTLLAKLTALHIWGEDTQFEIRAVCNNFNTFQKYLEAERFDLIIAENSLVENEFCQKIVEMKDNKDFDHIVLCSENGDFESARKGIIIGAIDYFTLPFDEFAILSLFNKIQKNLNSSQTVLANSIDRFVDKLTDLFISKSNDIHEYLEYLQSRSIITDVIDKALELIFQKNEWLDLYFNEQDFVSSGITNTDELKNRFVGLFECYNTLLPNHNETLDEVIKYILYNPESDLRQKVLSEEIHLNKSYLSTVFIAQTNVRFVDYVSAVKLLRASWLLKNTDMKVSEIAMKIDYKDVAYFSKQFKKYFNYTPTEYRLPDNYSFEI